MKNETVIRSKKFFFWVLLIGIGAVLFVWFFRNTSPFLNKLNEIILIFLDEVFGTIIAWLLLSSITFIVILILILILGLTSDKLSLLFEKLSLLGKKFFQILFVGLAICLLVFAFWFLIWFSNFIFGYSGGVVRFTTLFSRSYNFFLSLTSNELVSKILSILWQVILIVSSAEGALQFYDRLRKTNKTSLTEKDNKATVR